MEDETCVSHGADLSNSIHWYATLLLRRCSMTTSALVARDDWAVRDESDRAEDDNNSEEYTKLDAGRILLRSFPTMKSSLQL